MEHELVIKQIDGEIKKLRNDCWCNYKKLINALEYLKKVFKDTVKEIDDAGKNLEIYRKTLRYSDAEYWDTPIEFLYDDELILNNTWFAITKSDKDMTMFHELSHGQIDDVRYKYNTTDIEMLTDAIMYEKLMSTDVNKWNSYTQEKRRECPSNIP